jgi:hypothetical protein
MDDDDEAVSSMYAIADRYAWALVRRGWLWNASGRRRGTAFDSDDNDSDIGDVSLEPAPVCALVCYVGARASR